MRGILALLLIVSALPVFAAEEPSQYLIKFKSAVTLSDAQNRLARAGFRVKGFFEQISVFVAVPENIESEQDTVQKLKTDSDLAYAEKDLKHWKAIVERAPQKPQLGLLSTVRELYNVVPTDPLYSQQYGPKQVGAEQAWGTSTGSASVVVAISDTGVELTHPDLKDQVVAGWNYVDNNNDPSDKNGHGTHVAGIIGAEANNGVGVAGLNWKVSIMPVRFLDANGSGTDSAGVQTILFAADHGAKLINASWGSNTGSSALQDAVNYAFSHGTLFIAAAGNNSADNDTTGEYPAAYAPIAVAADDSNEQLASFSNYGQTTVGIAAPGVNILSSYLGATWKQLSGTSMATPMVTGVGALILSVNNSLSPLELRNAILNSAVAHPAYAGKVATNGEVNAEHALQQLSQGFQVWPNQITVGAGKTFQFTAYHSNGAVSWSTSDSSIARIASDGTLTGVKAGTVTVTSRDTSNATASATLVKIVNTTPGGGGGGCAAIRRGHWSPLEKTAAAANMSLPLLVGWFARRRWRA